MIPKLETDIGLETKTILKFVIKDKRERYCSFISKDKTRIKFIHKLAHFSDFDWKKIRSIESHERQSIFKELESLGNFKDCYVKIDGKRVNVELVLDISLGEGMGTILVFGEAEAIFHEGEVPNDRWISKIL